MSRPARFSAEDWLGIWTITLTSAAMFAFREFAITPRATVGLCAVANAPAICAPRAAVLWLQYEQGFGWAALVLGLFAFVSGRRWPGILAIALGVAAVINYNATTGILGITLGLITWISLCSGRGGKAVFGGATGGESVKG
jgi:hypothetical protein